MDNENEEDQPRVQADKNSIAVGGINIGGDITGNITIGHTGYTVEQVSILLTQITSTFQPKAFDGRCPYKGLDVFEEEDAELFFGRERLVDDLLSRVKESRTIFITGPSGSGKSSLVRAGLIHALKQGAIKNLHSERWLYETMKPGREPIKDLALAFSRLKSPDLADYFQEHASERDILNKCAESMLSGRKDQRFVLFIDQFEEVFTQINQEEERLAFLNMLAHAGTVENGRVIILFAMRSDFVSNCATYPALNEMLSQQFRQIGAMQPEELVSAIALPAKHVGLPIEDELIARIINDMKGEPGALPLMQFALKDLFDSQQEQGGVIALTLADYLRHGGIHKSLERHADKSFATLSENEQELARSIFSGLIEIGRGTQDTRRTALFDELVPASAKATEVESVVQRLADARLIITDEQAGKDTVTISHEKLIDAWPWLKKLVNENRDAIALQNQIAGDAKEWADHNWDASYLYSGARLGLSQEQLIARKIVLSGVAKHFIEEGINAREAERKRRETLRRRIISGLIFGMAVALGLAGFAIVQMLQAQRQTMIARAGELAMQSNTARQKNFQTSLLLAIEGFRSWDTVQSRGTLLDATNANPRLLQYLVGHTDWVRNIAFSPDGKTLASGSDDSTIILWDIETRQPIGPPLAGHTDAVISIAFSPDGKTLASGSGDGKIILWDLDTHQSIGKPLAGDTDGVNSLAFSQDGKTLASASLNAKIILWNVETLEPIGQPLAGHTDSVRSLAFSQDGKTLASGSDDGEIILWNVSTFEPIGATLTGYTNTVMSIAFTPDGKTLASGSSDNTIILWDMQALEPIGQPLAGHTDTVLSLAFSPDGKILASGSVDTMIILWDVDTHQPIGQPLAGHRDYVWSLAFSPDGKILASGSEDTTIILWDVEIHRPIGQLLTGFERSIAFSPDGKILALGSDDNTIVLWNIETRQAIRRPLTGLTSIFSPDGKTLASTSGDGKIILWDVDTHQPIGKPLAGHTDTVISLAFSPDSKTLASGSLDGKIILWNIETFEPIGQPLAGDTDSVSNIVFSPDGKTLASVGTNYTIILWDIETRQLRGQPLAGHTNTVISIAFSPDGKTLASASTDYTIILWDVETRQPRSQPLAGHLSTVLSVAFSPDGKTLASGSDDTTIILWDVDTRQPIGQPLAGHRDTISDVVFSPDGKTLASSSIDGAIILWNIYPEYWIQQSCQRVGRNLTYAEWANYLPYKPYPAKREDAACPQWPLEPEVIATSIP